MMFTPKTNEEIEAEKALLQPGEYKFVVESADERISKNGNPMIKLKLKVKSSEGVTYTLFDYLLTSDKMIWKLKHFCEAAGLENKYNEGAIRDSDCVGREGEIKTEIEESEGFPPKSSVVDYLINEKNESAIEKNKKLNEEASKEKPFSSEDFDDDIPF